MNPVKSLRNEYENDFAHAENFNCFYTITLNYIFTKHPKILYIIKTDAVLDEQSVKDRQFFFPASSSKKCFTVYEYTQFQYNGRYLQISPLHSALLIIKAN